MRALQEAAQRNRRGWSGLDAYPEADAILASDLTTQREVMKAGIDWYQDPSNRNRAGGRNYSHAAYATELIVDRIAQRRLELSEDDLLQMIGWSVRHRYHTNLGYTLKAVERYAKAHEIGHPLRSRLAEVRKDLEAQTAEQAQALRYARRIGELLGEKARETIFLDTREPWAGRVLSDLEQLDETVAGAMHALLMHVFLAPASKPSGKWQKEAATLAAELDPGLISACLTVWISAFDQPCVEVRDGAYYGQLSEWSVAEINADAMKGLIWLASQSADGELIRVIASAGLSGQKKIPSMGPRCPKVTNAAIWALSQIDDPLAIGQLAILRAKIKNKSTQKQIDKAIAAVAERVGVSPEEVEEMSVPTYGLMGVGQAREALGEFTAELVVTGTSSTELRWIKPDGKPQKSVPKVVKDQHGEELRALKASAKDIQKMLPAQRDRLDQLFLQRKTWAYATWAERYLDHPLVGTLARRLIWVFEPAASGEAVDAAWLDGRLVGADGEPAAIDPEAAIVSLWHPIGREEAQVVAWRRFFEEREVRQPFKQAHREVYLLTDAERTTNIYSNRYATHVLRQHQFKSLADQRGWRYALQGAFDSPDEVASRQVPGRELRAEFWVDRPWGDQEDEWNESGIFLRVVTDQVRFYPTDSVGRDTWHATGNVAGDAIPLDQIEPLVFSEIMRDVDLFVGVASVGNDPNWQDGGPEGRYRDYWHDYSFGDLGATSQTRREILQRLIPRLKIADRCSLDDKFLIVRGDRRTYKIHLGSSNILMEPNDQYLCIVPGRGGSKQADKLFLPFEGDQRLAVILSKAFMLAEDTKIKDPTILSQIGR